MCFDFQNNNQSMIAPPLRDENQNRASGPQKFEVIKFGSLARWPGTPNIMFGTVDRDNDISLRERFGDDGYLWIQKKIPKEIVVEWSAMFQSRLEDTLVVLSERHHTASAPQHNPGSSTSSTSSSSSDTSNYYTLGLGVKHGFREIVMRSPGRYEIAILDKAHHHHHHHNNNDDNNDDDDKIKTSAIYSVVQEHLPFVPDLFQRPTVCASRVESIVDDRPLTWEDVILQGMSIIVSTPGAVEQSWHSDGSHLSLEEHLPCHCLNIFIPLIDLTLDLGPTEIRPHSHWYTRNLAQQWLLAKARKTLRPVVAPCLQQSDCLIFDYRLLHRGLAHTSPIPQRMILNLTISLPWFKDIVNFPKRSMYDGWMIQNK